MMLLLFSTSQGTWPGTLAPLYTPTYIAGYCTPLYMAIRVNPDSSSSMLHDTVAVFYIPKHIA